MLIRCCLKEYSLELAGYAAGYSVPYYQSYVCVELKPWEGDLPRADFVLWPHTSYPLFVCLFCFVLEDDALMVSKLFF